jgi:hypothetical protein
MMGTARVWARENAGKRHEPIKAAGEEMAL